MLQLSELFRARVPEKVIQDRSGHRTLEGLCKYECISEQQRQEACKALRYSYITPRKDVYDLLTVTSPRARDVTGLSPVGYYSFAS